MNRLVTPNSPEGQTETPLGTLSRKSSGTKLNRTSSGRSLSRTNSANKIEQNVNQIGQSQLKAEETRHSIISSVKTIKIKKKSDTKEEAQTTPEKEESRDNVTLTISRLRETVGETQSNKRSIGGTSTMTRVGLSSFMESNNKTQGLKKSPHTSHTPKTPTEIALPTIESLSKLADSLTLFAKDYQANIEKLKQIRKQQTEENQEEWKAHEQQVNQMGLLLLQEQLGPSWETLQESLDNCLDFSQTPEQSPQEIDRILRKVKFLEEGFGSLFAMGKKASSKSLTKSLKEEEHVKLIREFLESFSLDFREGDIAFENKNNLKTMNKLNMSSHDLEDPETVVVVFNYIKQLIYLGEILKQQGHKLTSAPKHQSSILDTARKFAKNVAKLKDLKKIDDENKQKAIDLCCKDCGECVIEFARHLATRLNKYLQKDKDHLHTNVRDSFGGYSEAKTLKVLVGTTHTNSFGSEITRCMAGKIIHLSTDKKDIEIPKLTKAARKEDPEPSFLYHTQLLKFFMLNLGLTQEADNNANECVDPLQRLAETKSLDQVYFELEMEWKKLVMQNFYYQKLGIEYKKLNKMMLFKVLITLKDSDLDSIDKQVIFNICKAKWGVNIEGKSIDDHQLTDFEKLLLNLNSTGKIDKNLLSKFCQNEFGMANLDAVEIKNIDFYKPLLMAEGGYIREGYDAFERIWKKDEILASAPKMTGYFKLLPVLRAFNQVVLYPMHIGIISANKWMANRTQERLIRDIPSKSFRKDLDKEKGNERLDRDIKSISFDFKDDVVTITFWRQGALEKEDFNSPPKGMKLDTSNDMFHQCLIANKIVFTAPISDTQSGNLKASLEIERPSSENSNSLFLERYSSLIANLEIMGFNYTIKDV